MSDTELAMLFPGGSKKSFRCSCGSNVFRPLTEVRYACNACGQEYETVKLNNGAADTAEDEAAHE